jgi:hypothetical protein
VQDSTKSTNNKATQCRWHCKEWSDNGITTRRCTCNCIKEGVCADDRRRHEGLHHRPEATSGTERQWLSERQAVTPQGCSSGQEVRLTRVGAPSRRCPEQAHQHQHEAVR